MSKTSQANKQPSVVCTITDKLRSYADRGVFSNFSVRASTAAEGLVYYRFNWLTEFPFQLKLNPSKVVLELQDLLPAVAFRSDMDKSFRQFLKNRCAETVPRHRRLDNQRFHFKCINRQQKLSVAITFAKEDAVAATSTAINLIHEVFNNFLQDGPYQNYMVEVFNIAEE